MSTEEPKIQLNIDPITNSQNPEQESKSEQKEVYHPRKKKFGRTYINILHDPRVVRGNTYAAFVIPSSLQMEFMRLKEDEERKKRLMMQPKKLPRVALLGVKKKDEDEFFEENSLRPESPQFKVLDNPEFIEDKPYFFEDRPPTPEFIPLPKGREVHTQVEDGELFDYNLEVEPILEVLVGRSLVQARYELIAEDERKEYLGKKKRYEQKREFELINLQRMEAARIRREEEKQRRQNQVIQKKSYDIILQKKLLAKMNSKTYQFKNLKNSALLELFSRGFLKDNSDLKMTTHLEKCHYPQSDLIAKENEEVIEVLNNKLISEVKLKLSEKHKEIVTRENNRVNKIIADKKQSVLDAIENEKRRVHEKAERTEERRVRRITTNITENVINTRVEKLDVLNLPLADIDEISFKSEAIHCLGGQIGQVMTVLQNIISELDLEEVAINENASDVNIIKRQLVNAFLEEFFLNQLKENESFELRYLESQKFDFTNITEDKKAELVGFLLDYRRVVNKSLKLLIDQGILSRDLYQIFMEEVVGYYFKNITDPSTIEVDPSSQEPEYLEMIKKQQDELTASNAKIEKIKKKIILKFVKADDLKAKRDTYGGFILVHPNEKVIESVNEIEEVPIKIPEGDNIIKTSSKLGDLSISGKSNTKLVEISGAAGKSSTKLNDLSSQVRPSSNKSQVRPSSNKSQAAVDQNLGNTGINNLNVDINGDPIPIDPNQDPLQMIPPIQIIEPPKSNIIKFIFS
jgi:hypothetical protein